MSDVTIRDLRNHGDKVLDRVLSGETVLITRSGAPVAQLVPLPPKKEGLDAASLLARWRGLPPMDVAALRADLDRVLGPSLLAARSLVTDDERERLVPGRPT